MKRVNIILVSLLVFGFIISLLGAILKLIWNNYADYFLLVALIVTPISILGLIINNFSKIKRTLFR
jgi:hypothetical protein